MRTDQSEKVGTIRESHPEVCFWALNDGQATKYSKTGLPVAAFWERVEILERVDGDILGDIREGGRDLDNEATNEDLIDAFVLAITASQITREIYTLPQEWSVTDRKDSKGLPMEMVYAGFS